MQHKFSLLFVGLSALALFILAVPCDQSDAAPSLQDQYPYADLIISESSGGSVLLTYPVESGSDDKEWTTERIPSGSDHTVRGWSGGDGDLCVVMTGGTLGELILVGVDGEDMEIKPIDIDVTFEMYGGRISELRLVAVDDAVDLGTDYENCINPVNSAVFDLSSGRVSEFMPTDDLVIVDTMRVAVGSGMTVDRLHITGENGKYGEVAMDLLGGSVGYMANIRSIIGSLDYNLEAGTLNYLCIGADTEASTGASLAGLSTSYVKGDVSVHIDDSVDIRQAIIGGGIFSPPSLLWNGDSVSGVGVKNVIIDASGQQIDADSAFLTRNRQMAYHFDRFTMGSMPSSARMGTSVSHGDSSVPVYGEGGVWAGTSVVTIESGKTFYCNTQLTVPSDGVLTVDPNGSMVNSGYVNLLGSMFFRGTCTNNGVIVKGQDAGLYGTVGGDGHIAKSISITSPQDAISVMSSDEAVLILLPYQSKVSEISAVLGDDGRTVVIRMPEGRHIEGTSFLVCLEDLDEHPGFDCAYNLTILVDGGLPDVTDMEISVTVPVNLTSGYSGEVFSYDNPSGDYSPVDTSESPAGTLTFVTDSNGRYYIREKPAVDTPDTVEGTIETVKVVLLVVLILIALYGTVRVYLQLRRR